MYYAISTLNESATDRTGWAIYGQGHTQDEAEENANDHIGGRDMAKTTTEATLYRNLMVVAANQLRQYGLK